MNTQVFKSINVKILYAIVSKMYNKKKPDEKVTPMAITKF